MQVEKVLDKFRYTLSNENLKVGDKVFPIARGRCLDNDGWILHDFDYRDFISGFPDDPHTILDVNNSYYKPYQVKTDKGYSPIESYYKIIKLEEHITIPSKDTGPFNFDSMEWVEIDIQK